MKAREGILRSIALTLTLLGEGTNVTLFPKEREPIGKSPLTMTKGSIQGFLGLRVGIGPYAYGGSWSIGGT